MKKLRKVKNVFEVSQVEYDKLYSQNKVDDNDLYIIKDKASPIIKPKYNKFKESLINTTALLAVFIAILSIFTMGYVKGHHYAMQHSCPQAFEEIALTQEEL